jgi:uncharacterized DUF497 family protein
MFEWDDAKAAANMLKHGVDFARAVQIFRDATYVEGQDRRSEKEDRWLAVGTARGESYVVAFVWRGESRRIISAWKVGEKSKKRYQTLLLGRH